MANLPFSAWLSVIAASGCDHLTSPRAPRSVSNGNKQGKGKRLVKKVAVVSIVFMQMPMDSITLPRLSGVSLLTGPVSVHRLAHSWMARWALTGDLDVIDCAAAFAPLQILHALEDSGLNAWNALESIRVHSPRTPFEFLGASRLLAESRPNPVIIFSPLRQFMASSSHRAAGNLLLDGFLGMLSHARRSKARVLLIESERRSLVHRQGLAALTQAVQRTWQISAQGVKSVTGSPGPAPSLPVYPGFERVTVAM